mmetsp:Transcript_38849/g.82638  ORF Transcript_38849/g.82638 Transcript_38849/m.82638 type:complete len:247 (-) Transcript_38849:197-937(-)
MGGAGNVEGSVPAEVACIPIADFGADVSESDAIACLARGVEAARMQCRGPVQGELARQELQVHLLRADLSIKVSGSCTEASVKAVARGKRDKGCEEAPPIDWLQARELVVSVLVPVQAHGLLKVFARQASQELRVVEIGVLRAKGLCHGTHNVRMPRQVSDPREPDVIHHQPGGLIHPCSVQHLEALEARQSFRDLQTTERVKRCHEAVSTVPFAELPTRIQSRGRWPQWHEGDARPGDRRVVDAM